METPVNPVRPLPKNPKEDILFLDPETCDTFFSPISKKWYFVEPRINELTTLRVQVLEKRLIELGFTADFLSITKNLRTAMQLINKGQPNDAYTTLQNMLTGLTDLDNKTDISLWVCSVFIYEEGENPWEYSETLAIEKMKAWACFDKGFFLELAVCSLAAYKIDLNEIFQEYSPSLNNPKTERARTTAIKNLFGLKQD